MWTTPFLFTGARAKLAELHMQLLIAMDLGYLKSGSPQPRLKDRTMCAGEQMCLIDRLGLSSVTSLIGFLLKCS